MIRQLLRAVNTSRTRVVPGALVYDTEIVTDLAPIASRPLARRESVSTLSDFVTDIRCTVLGCSRAVLNVSLAEVATASPCPLCRQCTRCRQDCGEGLITHERNGW